MGPRLKVSSDRLVKPGIEPATPGLQGKQFIHYTTAAPSFVIILKRRLIALLLLSYRCIVTINVLWLFLTMLWVGLQCVIVVFPDHTHLLLTT